jgi:hypothetical protein
MNKTSSAMLEIIRLRLGIILKLLPTIAQTVDVHLNPADIFCVTFSWGGANGRIL